MMPDLGNLGNHLRGSKVDRDGGREGERERERERGKKGKKGKKGRKKGKKERKKERKNERNPKNTSHLHPSSQAILRNRRSMSHILITKLIIMHKP